MDYVIAVQAPAYAISSTRFATESAFAAHLKDLRKSIGSQFHRLVLLAPFLNEELYEKQKYHLGVLDSVQDEIVFLPAFPLTSGAKQFWLSHAWTLWRQIKKAIATAGVVHAGMSTDTWRPFLAMVNLAGWQAGRPVVFIVDIDFRQHSWRYYKLGIWSWKSYWVNRAIHDKFKWLQCWLAPRMHELVLLKSASMVRDFGKGRSHVKNFFDTAYSHEQILVDDELQLRLNWLRKEDEPLRMVYFGRLVKYKGLDRMIEAVRLAREQGSEIRLTILGDGESLLPLQEQVKLAKLESQIDFKPQVPYGPELFSQLGHAHLSVATPLVEDTPRSAFDSMARGIPILAFDISYFRDLAQESGAVTLAQWPSSQALADQLHDLDKRREQIAVMATRAVAFSKENTQKQWLEKRMQWIREFTIMRN